MIDKNKQLAVSIDLLNDKHHFEGNVRGNEPISIDYYSPIGDNLGYTSLELFLLSLSSCCGSETLIILRRMNKTIIGFDVITTGIRQESEPAGFKSISMVINLKSRDTSQEEMNNILMKVRNNYSFVVSMLNEQVELDILCNIIS